MWALAAVLGCAFAYCGWRYYTDAYLPNRQITDADRHQRELFARIRPHTENITQTDADSTPDVEIQAEEDLHDPLAELRAENADTVGWLTIEGTNIDYPIVQAEDNGFYLQRGFDKQENYGLGCPFLDSRCKSLFSGLNSIVYAHHIKGNAAMFADIAKYKDSNFMEKYPTGTLLTADGVHDVRFFAYMTIPSTAPEYSIVTEEKERDGYIDSIYKDASYTAQISCTELKDKDDPHLLLLSTCTYEYWEARGVLVGVIE